MSGLNNEQVRKIFHYNRSRMTQLTSAALAEGTSKEKLDSAAMTFMHEGNPISGLTLNEAVITSWVPAGSNQSLIDQEAFKRIGSDKACAVLFLVDENSTATAISARQGLIVPDTITPEYPGVPDDFIVIGGATIISPTDVATGFDIGDATSGLWDATGVTLVQFFWPPSGPHGWGGATLPLT